MKCNRCNKDGAYPYKYNENGCEYDVSLCDSCVEELRRAGAMERLTPLQKSTERRSPSILGMERRCPSCGKSLASIKKTGYFGCANCFFAFRSELIPTIDKLQNNVISAPEKKQRELTVILLEDEYAQLLSKRSRHPAEMNATADRLREITAQLASLGVRVDE